MINHYQDNPMDALKLLVEKSLGTDRQAHHIRRFLLGLYNPEQWPFEMNRLRALETKLQMACLRVLELDVMTRERDIHEYIKDGGQIFGQLWESESTQ